MATIAETILLAIGFASAFVGLILVGIVAVIAHHFDISIRRVLRLSVRVYQEKPSNSE